MKITIRRLDKTRYLILISKNKMGITVNHEQLKYLINHIIEHIDTLVIIGDNKMKEEFFKSLERIDFIPNIQI